MWRFGLNAKTNKQMQRINFRTIFECAVPKIAYPHKPIPNSRVKHRNRGSYISVSVPLVTKNAISNRLFSAASNQVFILLKYILLPDYH